MKQHSPQFLKLVSAVKERVKEIDTKTLKEKIDHADNFTLIDVREDNEWAKGAIPKAIHIGKGVIERDIENAIPDFNQEIIVYCSGGFRSALVADTLHAMGYERVYSLAKGSQGWIDAGFSINQTTKTQHPDQK